MKTYEITLEIDNFYTDDKGEKILDEDKIELVAEDWNDVEQQLIKKYGEDRFNVLESFSYTHGERRI